MKLDLRRRSWVAIVLGLIVVGFFLATKHWGFAIKITNYFFFGLLAIVIYEIIFFKK